MTKMTEMTQKESRRHAHQPPYVEIIYIETQCVLCGSELLGNSTESVTTEDFMFP